MPVPDYETLILPNRRALAGGVGHPAGALRSSIASELKLTEQDRAKLRPSWKQAFLDIRVAWAKTYLDKAGLVASVRTRMYGLTYIDLPA
jgi:restriction system protein